MTLEGLNANLKKPGVAMYIAHATARTRAYKMEQFVVRKGLAGKVRSPTSKAKLMSAPGPGQRQHREGRFSPRSGLKDGDYTIDQLDMGQHVNAMKAGTFDGGYTLEPNAIDHAASSASPRRSKPA